MALRKLSPAEAADLRKRAEDQAGAVEAGDENALTPEKTHLLVHELRVHQIELEMQNEELRRAQEELEASRMRYFDLYDLAPVGYCTLSEHGLILEANLTAAGLLGVPRSALVKKRLAIFVLPEDQDIFYQHRKRLFETGTPQVCEIRLLRADTAPFWARIEATVAQDANGAPTCRAVISDITEMKRAETELARVNRALRMLNDANQALIRSADEATLMNEVCRIAVEVGGYRLAWVGFAEQDDAQTVRPVTQAGFEDGYLSTINITWADTEQGRGPTGTAIRSGQPCIARDIHADPNFAPWREEATRRGYTSSISLPLFGDRVFGALNIYATDADAFDAREIEILKELAGNLAFGIIVLRTKILRNLAEEALRKSESDLKEAQRLAGIGSWDWDAATDTITWSEEYYRIYGFDPTQRPPGYEEHLKAYTPESAALLDAAVKRNMQTGESYELDLELAHTEGPRRWITARSETKRDTQGEIVGLRGTAQDITERRRAEQVLKVSEVRYRRLFETAKDGILLIDSETEMITDVNPFLVEMLGYTYDDFIGKKLWELGTFKDVLASRSAFEKLKTDEYVRYENLPLQRKDGHKVDVEFVSNAYRIDGGKVIQCNIRDITERRRAEEELRYVGTHDSLTGVYNRAYFEAELKRLERGRVFPVSVAVGDIDRLKDINDSLGHFAGDDMLRRVGQVLIAAFRSEDVVARIGGDEFAVLLPGVNEEMAAEAMTRVRNLVDEHNRTTDKPLLSFSLGVATGDKGCALNTILKKADDLMYENKLSKTRCSGRLTTGYTIRSSGKLIVTSKRKIKIRSSSDSKSFEQAD